MRVVDLVRAGVGELVALEVDARAAELGAEPLGQIERASAGRRSRRARRRARPERPDRPWPPRRRARARGSAASGSRRRSGRRRCRTGRARRGRPDRCWAGSSAGTRGGRAGRGLRDGERRAASARKRRIFAGSLCAGPALDAGRHVDRGRTAQRRPRLRDCRPTGRPRAATGSRRAGPRSSRQSKARPLPPGRRPGSLGGSRVEQQHVGDRGVARDRRQVRGLGDLQRLDHGAAGARLDRARRAPGFRRRAAARPSSGTCARTWSSSASSGSTNTPTVVRSAGAARARSPARSGLSARGEGG